MMLKFKNFILAACLFVTICVQAADYSGTVPVIFINTENNTPITSKEDYLQATYYLDPMGIEGIEAFGSVDNQLPLEIRGRGNYTWNGFDKKPYRLKFGAKTAILGMNKSKHFALMANADDELSGLRNAVGYELARMIGMPWTPSAKPVEVVLNGEYIGLYFLTETIRIDSDRVNIVEQADEETDPYAITGGWLVEIDNYDSDPHVRITEGNGERIIFTYKTPEILSTVQEEYLRNQMTTIDAAIYNKDKNNNEWENYIDLDRLVRFYIVQEILDNAESFHGSCYLHREIGEDQKWMFGPVWDFGNTFRRGGGQFIHQNPPYGQTWIAEIAQYPHFQEKVSEVWKEFRANNFDDIYTFIDNYVTAYEKAIQADDVRWPDYGSQNVQGDGATMKNNIRDRAKFLVEHWGDAEKEVEETETSYTVYFTAEGTEWENIHAYSWDYDGAVTVFLGNWPGTPLTETTTIEGKEYYTITFDPGRTAVNPMIIFNDGNSGVGEHQTEDLALQNYGIYDHNGIIGTHTALDATKVVTADIATNGLTIYAQGDITLYNIQGLRVAQGYNQATAPTAGIYIVVNNGTATKVVLR